MGKILTIDFFKTGLKLFNRIWNSSLIVHSDVIEDLESFPQRNDITLQDLLNDISKNENPISRTREIIKEKQGEFLVIPDFNFDRNYKNRFCVFRDFWNICYFVLVD